MKKVSSKKTESEVAQVLGGQPENDRDARGAGVASATSVGGAEPTKRNDGGKASADGAKRGRKE